MKVSARRLIRIGLLSVVLSLVLVSSHLALSDNAMAAGIGVGILAVTVVVGGTALLAALIVCLTNIWDRNPTIHLRRPRNKRRPVPKAEVKRA